MRYFIYHELDQVQESFVWVQDRDQSNKPTRPNCEKSESFCECETVIVFMKFETSCTHSENSPVNTFAVSVCISTDIFIDII